MPILAPSVIQEHLAHLFLLSHLKDLQSHGLVQELMEGIMLVVLPRDHKMDHVDQPIILSLKKFLLLDYAMLELLLLLI
jgi:hypothetical protein